MIHSQHTDYFGAKLGMWLFLLTELLLFGGLFLLYAVYLKRYPHEFSAGGTQLNWMMGAANTVILLTSSLFAAMAVTAMQRNEQRRAMGLLGATILCAICFMGIKYFEWSAKIGHGVYVKGSDPEIDTSLVVVPALTAFLQQERWDVSSFEQTVQSLADISQVSA